MSPFILCINILWVSDIERVLERIFRSSRSQMLLKIGVLKRFCKFQRKTPVMEYLLNKFVGLKACNFINKRFHHKCFPLKFAKLFKNTYFEEHLRTTTTKFYYLRRNKFIFIGLSQTKHKKELGTLEMYIYIAWRSS